MEEQLVVRDRRSVLPDLAYKFHIQLLYSFLGLGCSFDLLISLHGDYPTVKADTAVFGNYISQPLIQSGIALRIHFEQLDSTSGQLFICLNEISSVCPKTGFRLCKRNSS